MADWFNDDFSDGGSDIGFGVDSEAELERLRVALLSK